MLLRPEQLRLTDPDTAGASGTVTDVRFYGHDAMVTVAVDGIGEAIDVRVPGPTAANPGERTGIEVLGEATLYSAAL